MTRSLFVERFLGDAEGVDRGRHPAVEDHLSDDLRDLLLGYANVQRPCDVTLDHLRAVPQHDQGGDGAQAAGAQVYRGTVVNLAVDHLVNQPHHVWREFHHRRRRLGIVVGPVVEHPEFGGRLLQIYLFYSKLLVVLGVAVAKVQVVIGGVSGWRLVGSQIRVVLVVFSGHGVHLVGVSSPP